MARSKKDDREDNLRLIADENEKLDLIRVNVDNVKKDVKDISVYTEKQIQAISKAIDREIKKFDELQAKVKQANGDINRETQRTLQTTIQNIDSLTNRIVNAGRAEQQQLQEISNQRRRMSEEERKERAANRAAGRAQYADTYRSEVNRETQNTQQLISNISSGKLGSAFSSLASRRSNMRIANAENIMNDLTQQYKEGKISRNAFQAGIRQQTQAINKFSASVTLFQTVGNVFQGFLDAFVKKFDEGMNRILDSYERTFTNQAVMTGISTREYQNWQNETVRQLEQQGLKNNIAISDIMETTNQFVTDGITNFTKASQMGQTAAIGKVLAPYLTQNTEAFESMSIALGPDFSKAMMGMQKYVSTETGSSRFISKNLNAIIDKMEPIVMASNKQLMGDEEWTQLEMLMQNGYTESEAMELVSEAMDTIRNPSGAISNGSTLQAMQVAAGRYTDVSQYIAGRLGDAASLLTGTTGLGRSAAAEAIGAGYKSYLQSDEQNYKQARIAAQYAVEDALRSPTGASTKRATQSFQDQMVKLANDNLQTMKKLETNYLENISTYLATIVENIPTTWEVIRGVGSAIVSALLMWAGSKIFNSLTGGKGITGLFGKSAGKHAATGAATGAGAKGASSLGAVALPAAGAVAGAGLGIYNGINAVNDFKAGRTGYGVANTVGAVAGGTAAVTLGATAASAAGVGGAVGAFGAMAAVPVVGWAALAVAGIVAAGVAIGKAIDAEAKQRERANNTLKDLVDDEMKERKKSQQEYIDDLYVLRSRVKQAATDEEARRILIEEGIVTEEQLTDSKDKSREALIRLTDAYIADTKARTDKDNKALESLKTLQMSEREAYANDAWNYTDWLLGDNMWNREMHELSWQDRDAAYKLVAAMAKYGESNYEGMSEKEKKVFDKIKEVGLDRAKVGDDSGLTWEEMDSIIDKMDSQEEATRSLVKRSLMADGAILEEYAKTSSVRNKYGKDAYVNTDYSSAFDNYLSLAHEATLSDSKAKSYLQSFKSATGLTWDKLPQETKDYIQEIMDMHHIPEYKGGTSYVAADGLAFLAHEGEAVLTPAAASILRAATDSDISTVQGVSDALSTSSNLTREGFALVTSAIENQTAQLSSKIDQVISVLNNNRVVANYNSKLVNLRGGLTPDAQ